MKRRVQLRFGNNSSNNKFSSFNEKKDVTFSFFYGLYRNGVGYKTDFEFVDTVLEKVSFKVVWNIRGL